MGSGIGAGIPMRGLPCGWCDIGGGGGGGADGDARNGFPPRPCCVTGGGGPGLIVGGGGSGAPGIPDVRAKLADGGGGGVGRAVGHCDEGGGGGRIGGVRPSNAELA